jgi:hypothetical protein
MDLRWKERSLRKSRNMRMKTTRSQCSRAGLQSRRSPSKKIRRMMKMNITETNIKMNKRAAYNNITSTIILPWRIPVRIILIITWERTLSKLLKHRRTIYWIWTLKI